MIERYTRKEIKSIWEDKNKYSLWLKIELAAAEAMEKLKIIPKVLSFLEKRPSKLKNHLIYCCDSEKNILSAVRNPF